MYNMYSIHIRKMYKMFIIFNIIRIVNNIYFDIHNNAILLLSYFTT